MTKAVQKFICFNPPRDLLLKLLLFLKYLRPSFDVAHYTVAKQEQPPPNNNFKVVCGVIVFPSNCSLALNKFSERV